jgi:light-regulated signal transduction histidine kinase (bacteriophytochrome)
MTPRNASSLTAIRSIRPYGLAIGLIALAIALALVAEAARIDKLEFPIFLMAVGAAVWYAGRGPGVLAVLLASLSFNYFFTSPRFSLSIDAADRAYFVVFVLFALMIGLFASRRRRIEQELRQARDELQMANADLERRTIELEASNRELEAFTYSTSHDLRAPLRHLAGYTELLQKHASSVLDEKSRRYVRMILESAKRMGDLIDDLLAFSRIGRAETRYTLVSLEELVREASSEMKEESEGRKIVWKIGALPSLQGDRSMLRVALVNLMSNAVKFTRTRPQAEIEIGCAEGKPGEVVVFVRDNGVGFDMKYVGKLFGVFQRLHLPETFEGTGIGLATVQRIVARHGGRVWAEGAVDAGATFYFSAPKIHKEEAWAD